MAELKANLISGAIGGVTGITTALVIIAIHEHFGGISAGDVLQFLGAVMGTGLAVGGAVWIEERKRKLGMADAAMPVLDALIVLEHKSRPFFEAPEERERNAEGIERQMVVLEAVLALSPPRSARMIGLFYKLRLAAAYLTSDAYLKMNVEAPFKAGPERHRVEEKLEYFDGPLKLLIVEYSRLIDPKAPRSVAHLGAMPDI